MVARRTEVGEKALLIVRGGRLHAGLAEYLDNGRYASTTVLPLIDTEESNGTRIYSVITKGKNYTIDIFVELVKLLEAGEFDSFTRRANRLGLAEGESMIVGR